MPSFCAINPERIGLVLASAPALELDLDVDAGREVELHQRVDGLRGWIDDVEQALMGAHLELLAALLVDVRRAVDGEFLDFRRQRDGPAHLCAGALGGRHDLARGRVENAVVERLQPDADVLAVHGCSLGSLPKQKGRGEPRPSYARYSMMLATTPAPTVRPPSRIAKRSFSSIAIGTISCTSMAMLSPGITISVPCGSVTTPVTSVVRK